MVAISWKNRVAPGNSLKMQGDFVLLRADGLRLLLPQKDVSSTEYIESTPEPSNTPGVYLLQDPDGTEHQVIALSESMSALGSYPRQRFLLTRHGDATHDFSLAWSDVRVLIDTELEFHALPAVMQEEGALIDAYVEIDGELAFCTTAPRLLPHEVQRLE